MNGPTRASPDNLGSDGLYAAIDADNVVLAGEVVIRVNYQHAPGDSETINLLNADNITIDPSASVLIEGLASGIRLTNPSVVAADSGSRY
ncbi:hypothetical protein BST95_15555 [Halioglobus japonicus]|uniref:Uncharacterized protein n=1 Tax=Halioglobus japonicus TaxID=930805 RepID=A0AAP8MGL8_9GAMM|nr:hypothetical protein [Halioglobus japonicus]AQA19439.1 hypothetical protein BST95_15555 [Halioglobus japonicus]PLW87503.1 hypothetical protein C0029_02640 [Halioglobus japonicus]GHD08123.1 hypothetical protein GCM10007052_04690 [Halioglobus japonicus]